MVGTKIAAHRVMADVPFLTGEGNFWHNVIDIVSTTLQQSGHSAGVPL